MARSQHAGDAQRENTKRLNKGITSRTVSHDRSVRRGRPKHPRFSAIGIPLPANGVQLPSTSIIGLIPTRNETFFGNYNGEIIQDRDDFFRKMDRVGIKVANGAD